MQLPQDQRDPRKSKPAIWEMVGATSAPFSLSTGPTHASFALHAPTGPALLRADGKPRRVLLRVENITSQSTAPSIDIYLNVPPGDEPAKRPDLRAGTISTFGLPSSPDDQHAGNGLAYTEDVTALYLRLAAARDWDPKNLRVSLVPATWDYPVEVQIGRVCLMLE